jgi:hypothetical protein
MVTDLHAAFMASPGHRDSVLAAHDRVAAGVVIDGDTVRVTVNFVRDHRPRPRLGVPGLIHAPCDSLGT